MLLLLLLLLSVQLKQCTDEGTVSFASHTNKTNNASDRNPQTI